MRPTVSVIIPNYNYARFLTARIDSVLAQTYQDFEIIILDDHSTDNSAEVIERYRNNPKVSQIVINEKNTGSPFAQWEKGLSMARGKYAWIAEADDLMEPTFLEKGVKMMEEEGEELKLVMALSNIIDGEGKVTDRVGYDKRMEADGTAEIYSGREFIASNMRMSNGVYNASQVLFRIDALTGFDNFEYREMRYCGDWLFWIEVMKDGKVGVIREKLNSFRKHGKSVSNEGEAMISGPYLEVQRIWIYLMTHEDTMPRAVNRVMRYRMARNLKRDFSHPNLVAMGINRWKFAGLWLYKHFCYSEKKHKAEPLAAPLKKYTLC